MNEGQINHQELINCRLTLQDQLFLQTAAMFKYCNRAGIIVPANLFTEFDDVFQQWIQCRQSSNGGSKKARDVARQDDKIPANNQPRGQGGIHVELSKVADIHNELTEKVDPATPGAILLIESEMKKGRPWRHYIGLRFLGPVKIVRAMMGASIFMLAAFLIFACFEVVNLDNLAQGLFVLHGKELLYNLLFLLSSAGIGASFAALFEVRTYITKRTYDTVYATDYWIRFILGLVSGLILAELVPVQDLIESESYIGDLARPVLAMLGGFSVQAVYRVLQRIVHTLETLVQGREIQNEAEMKAKVKEESKKQNLKTRTAFLSHLAEIQKVISQGDETDKIKATVDDVFKKISLFGGV